MIKLELENNKGYKWTHYDKIHCKGYAFIDDVPLENEDLAKQFENLDKAEVLKFAQALEGFFSVVIEYENAVLALVDHVRSFPLFYYNSEGNLILCDTINEERIKTLSWNKNAKKQFQGALYLLGEQTLFDGVNSIEAASFCWVTNTGVVETDFYRVFSYCENQISDLNIALDKMTGVYKQTFERLIKYLNGRTAVIPLSGGHDSRLVAYYLLKLGYRNIIAFSYGDPKMIDSIISKQVAATLGIKYYYIPYERNNMRKAFKKYYQEYLVYAANGVSVPVIQTWYAVHWLKEHNIIDDNCVFCPGYGGILPGHYVETTFVNSEFVEKNKLLHHFEVEFFSCLSRLEPEYYPEFKNAFLNKRDIAQLPEKVPSKRAAEIFEQWIYREDQAKFIQNANRLYECFGVKWATPFFEKVQFDLWASIDNCLRLNNKAFKEMETSIFEGDIASISFTGSKENILTPKKRSAVQKCIHMADVCLRPRKHHYMNVIVPFGVHVYHTVVKRISSPSYYTQCIYLKYLKKHTRQKN